MAVLKPPNEDPVTFFQGVEVLTPRERCTVELHLSFFRFPDFEVPYSIVTSICLLPKSNQPYAFVVVTLNPPIWKDGILYPHIVFQFENELVVRTELLMDEDLLNDKYKDRLQPSYEGLISEVLAMILGGLSGSRVIKPKYFRSRTKGNAVICSLKTEGGAIDNGVMYPVETGFLFLSIPPTLILDDEVDYIDFVRRGSSFADMYYFDLVLVLKNDQKLSFQNIETREYSRLFRVIWKKRLRIPNLPHPVDAAVLQDDDDDDDDEEEEEEEEEEDDDFVIERDNGGEEEDEDGDDAEEDDEFEIDDFIIDEDDDHPPESDISESGVEDESDASQSDDFIIDDDDGIPPESDASESGIEEEDISDANESGGEEQKTMEEPGKEASTSRSSSSKKRPKDGDEDGSNKRKNKRSQVLVDVLRRP